MSNPAVPDRSLDHLYPDFASKVRDILDELSAWCAVHWPGHTAALAEGYRSARRQAVLYNLGRTVRNPDGASAAKPLGDIVTDKNGTTNPSNHQSALACDIVAHGKGGLTWDCPAAFWQYYGHLVRAQGLVWGGSWKTLVDLPHCEMPTTDKATYAAARAWVKTQGL